MQQIINPVPKVLQMKKIVLFLSLPLLVMMCMSCSKNSSCSAVDTNKVAPAAEIANLQDSLTKYGIEATQHPSGIFYKIINPGSGGIVSNLCTQVSATYWGGFFDGRSFDQSVSPLTFTLGATIVGWHKGIPLVKEGGEIEIYIPPSLGYGDEDMKDNNGVVVIPKNSYLVFKVKVVKFS